MESISDKAKLLNVSRAATLNYRIHHCTACTDATLDLSIDLGF